jgi:hypothetical protein
VAERSSGYLQLSEAYEGEAAKASEFGWPVQQQALAPSPTG